MAVANALPVLKARAQVVTRGEGGQGVAELIEHLIAFDVSNSRDSRPSSGFRSPRL